MDGDPEALEAHARRLDGAAQEVRERARRLRAEARRMRWRGVAAAAFVADLDRDLTGLDRAADALEEAAAHVRRQGREAALGLGRFATPWFGERSA